MIIVVMVCFEGHFYKIFEQRTGIFLNISERYKDKSENIDMTVYKPKNATNKRPILLMGCSYTYGQWLTKETNISAKLANLTGRTVYNTGIIGGGPIAQLKFLYDENKKHKIDISSPPEYVVYTYMFHHIDRWQYWQYYDVLRKLGIIKNQPYNKLYYSYTYSYIRNTEFDNYIIDNNYQIDLFVDILKGIKDEINLLYPDCKFIILIYSDENYDICEDLIGKNSERKARIDELFKIMYSTDFRERLEKIGVQIISTEELIGRRMYKKEDRIPSYIDMFHPHPSETAWDEILPKLIIKLGV